MTDDATQKHVDEARADEDARNAAYQAWEGRGWPKHMQGMLDVAIDAYLTLAAQRPLVSPEQREALDELIEGVLIAERDEWPRDPGDAPSEVLAGAVTDAILARFTIPVLDVVTTINGEPVES